MRTWFNKEIESIYIGDQNYYSIADKIVGIVYEEGFWKIVFDKGDYLLVKIIGNGIDFSYKEEKGVK
ncbi:MAG: hypothetical protein DDT40_01537 [candidate division WS2 bacterium]|nr:hypothetical protein [Candidatus Psychracetigena formicireducens]